MNEFFKEIMVEKIKKIIGASRSITHPYDDELHKQKMKPPSLLIIIRTVSMKCASGIDKNP